MIPQENIEADFKDWLAVVQVMLETQIFMELPGKRIQKLSAYILLRAPAKTLARELVNELPDSLIEELSNKPLESLVHELAQELNNYLLSSLARTMTDWLEKKLRAVAPKDSPPPRRSPEEMAENLVRTMADEASDDIFCPSETVTTTRPGKAAHSAHSIRQDFQGSAVPLRLSFDQPGYVALLMRAHAVRFRIAGMAAIMLFARIHNGKTINEHSMFGQN